MPKVRPTYLITLLFLFLSIEWSGRNQNYAIEKMFFKKTKFVRWGFYIFLLALTFIFSATEEQPFIYFQF